MRDMNDCVLHFLWNDSLIHDPFLLHSELSGGISFEIFLARMVQHEARLGENDWTMVFHSNPKTAHVAPLVASQHFVDDSGTASTIYSADRAIPAQRTMSLSCVSHCAWVSSRCRLSLLSAGSPGCQSVVALCLFVSGLMLRYLKLVRNKRRSSVPLTDWMKH